MISLPPSSKDVLIVGASGMLGRELAAACRRRGVPVVERGGGSSLDITCAPAVQRVLHETRPAIVFNAAGYTNVDGAECDFEQALAVNGDGPGHLGCACREVGALLVHYSTDYVFNGHAGRPYRTDDAPDPISSYGLSKLAGEKAVISSGCEHLILRTSWLFAPHGKNFVATIVRLARAREREGIDVVNDQRGRPTSCTDLAEMTLALLDRGFLSTARCQAGRILHAANSGHATWFDFARRIVAQAGLQCEVRPCTSASRLLHAPRPAYSVLDLSETADIIGKPRHWRLALRDCLRGIGIGTNGQMELFPIAPYAASTTKEEIT